MNIEALKQQAMNDYRAGRFEAALQACEQLMSMQPDQPGVVAFAGVNALRARKYDTAARLFEQVVENRPDHVEAWYNLGEALRFVAKYDEAAEAYEAALKLDPKLAQAWHGIGQVWQAREKFDKAETAFREAIGIAPDAEEPRRGLGIALEELGDVEGAIEQYIAARGLKPRWLGVFPNLAGAFMKAGRAREAVELCEEWLKLAPGTSEAFARLALALLEADERDAARQWLDFDRFVYERLIDPPRGYDSLGDFNRALVEHVTGHPTMGVPDESLPVYHHPNLQITEELLTDDGGPVSELERIIREAIDEYYTALRATGPHPFIDNWPASWRMSAWATQIVGEGQLVPHIHLDGYLGGSYYPELPDVVTARENESEKQGWFELGRPEDVINLTKEPEVRALKPEEGKLILFPGYFYHCTIPFRSPQRRISIAFDLVPEND